MVPLPQWGHEGHHPGGRHRLAPAPRDRGREQAAGAGLRQADDLLPAVHAAAGGGAGRPGDHHPARRRAVRAPARGRLALWCAHQLRAAGAPERARPGVHAGRRAHRGRQRVPGARGQHLPRARAGHAAAPLPGPARRGDLRVPGRGSGGVRRRGVRRRRAGRVHRGEAGAPPQPLRRAGSLLLRPPRGGVRPRAHAVRARGAGDHGPEPRGHAPRRARRARTAPRHRVARHRHVRLPRGRHQLHPHGAGAPGHLHRQPGGGRVAPGPALGRAAARAGGALRVQRLRRVPGVPAQRGRRRRARPPRTRQVRGQHVGPGLPAPSSRRTGQGGRRGVVVPARRNRTGSLR